LIAKLFIIYTLIIENMECEWYVELC